VSLSRPKGEVEHTVSCLERMRYTVPAPVTKFTAYVVQDCPQVGRRVCAEQFATLFERALPILTVRRSRGR
jgi:hypothetical protein